MGIRVEQAYEQAWDHKKHFMRGVKAKSARAEPIEGNDDLRVEVRFSSNAKIDMWYGDEILLHDESNVDLSRFNSGTRPVMKDHRWSSDNQIGVIESARVDGEFGYAVIRFSENERAFYNDVINGIRDNISFGYDVKEYRVENADTGDPTYIATRWVPDEISFTPFPADDSAGVIRSVRSDILFQEDLANQNRDDTQGGDDSSSQSSDDSSSQSSDDSSSQSSDDSSSQDSGDGGGDRARVNPSDLDKDKTRDAQAIMKLCEDLDQLDTERGVQAIRDGKTFETFQSEVLQEFSTGRLNADTGELEVDEEVRYRGLQMEHKDIEKFRVINLIAGEENKQGTLGGFEREICEAERELKDKAGMESQGYAIPGAITGSRAEYNARRIQEQYKASRNLVAGINNQGGHLVDEILLVEHFIDILYANHPVSGAAMWLNDIQGTIAIPKQNGRVVAEWTEEIGPAPESTPTFELIQMSPKELRARVDWSRTFAIQSSVPVENLARRNIVRQIGETADEALVYGDGTGHGIEGITQIAAIKNAPNNQRKQYPAGGIRFADCVNAIADVGNANAMGSMAQWITSWGFWEQCKTTIEFTDGDRPIWDEMNQIAGFKADATSQIKSVDGADTDADHAFFANWEYLYVPQWGGLDIVVDPFTLAHTGQIRIIVFMRIDTGIAHDEAFIQLRRS